MDERPQHVDIVIQPMQQLHHCALPYLQRKVIAVGLYLVRQHRILSPFGNSGHHAHALVGKLAIGSLAREHHSICAFSDSNGNVGDLSPGRCGVGYHGLQHVCGHNDRLAALPAALYNATLPVWDLQA